MCSIYTHTSSPALKAITNWFFVKILAIEFLSLLIFVFVFCIRDQRSQFLPFLVEKTFVNRNWVKTTKEPKFLSKKRMKKNLKQLISECRCIEGLTKNQIDKFQTFDMNKIYFQLDEQLFISSSYFVSFILLEFLWYAQLEATMHWFGKMRLHPFFFLSKKALCFSNFSDGARKKKPLNSAHKMREE